jgi:phospholipid/cholesterol/gamma-HCH transport system substrate-binding protein
VKPFRERNPVTIGFAGLLAIALMLLAAFKAEDLPLIGGGDVYHAHFSEAGGLDVNDEVRVAGVRVGKVEEITLDRGKVLVGLRVDDGVELGDRTGASIRVKTLLGAMYVALEPAGSGQLDPETTIPLERTSAPYDVVEAFSDLASTEQQIDTERLGTALDTLADLTRDTPDEVRASLTGLSRLSRNVAKRDEQLNTLLTNAEKVSDVLADRNRNLELLFRDGQVLLEAVYARRDAIHDLLTVSVTLSRELTTLVRESREDLRPALEQLDRVVDLLNARQEQLDESLRLMAPFYRVFANTLGTGPWFDTYIQNMPPVPDLTGAN